MKKLFELLLYGHTHTWEVLHEERVFREDNPSDTTLPVGIRYTLRCSKCGNIKYVRAY